MQLEVSCHRLNSDTDFFYRSNHRRIHGCPDNLAMDVLGHIYIPGRHGCRVFLQLP